jgi:hypothetical protein
MYRHYLLRELFCAALIASWATACTSSSVGMNNPPDDTGSGTDDTGDNNNGDATVMFDDSGNPIDTGQSGGVDASPDAGTNGQDATTMTHPDAMPPDLGPAEWCGALASPAQSGTCCNRCTGNDCAPNGCYGGRWCQAEPNMCYCQPAPALCTAPHGPGSTGGPLTCPAPANYDHSTGSRCGAYRWSVKTCSDNGASNLGPNTQQTTLADLVAISAPGSTPSNSRVDPVENTIYELRNVTLSYVRANNDMNSEFDSDYHLAFNDRMQNSMIGEVPFPDCVSGAPQLFDCSITRARAAMETQFPGMLSSSSPFYPNLPVTVVGVGFWDTIHGQHGVAPNGIELHPILAICFGLDCNPYP